MPKKDINLSLVTPLSENSSFIKVGVNYNNPIVSGKSVLVQKVIKSLLTYKGSNLFNKNLGSYFSTYINKKHSTDDILEFVPIILKDIEEDIIITQMQDKPLSLSEKLLSLDLDTLNINKETGEVNIFFSVVTADNLKTTFTINR